VLTGEDRYRVRADRLLEGLLPLAAENLVGHMALLCALDLRLRHREIVAVGKRAGEFAAAALRLPFLDRTILRVSDAEKLPAAHPARAMAESAPEEGAAFVCQGERCSLPITEPGKLAESVSARA